MSLPYKKDWLIIANGEPVAENIWLKLAEGKSIMVLDGAFHSDLMKLITPDVVIGDFDSIDANVDFIHSTITFVKETEQETTDLEKGLLYLAKINPGAVTIVNATGWRLDHTLYNLRLLKRFHGAFKSLSIVTTIERICYVENQTVILHVEKAQPFAMLACPEATVCSSGLRYDMDHLKLRLGHQESTSNFVLKKEASIVVDGGALLLMSHATQMISVES